MAVDMDFGCKLVGGGAGEVECLAASFENLPEGCVANAISFTNARDACRLSLVSSIFRSAAESDQVWERFLPSDYRSILSRSSLDYSSSLCFSSKKELYFSLCENPVLIDQGQKSFSLDKCYGKKCYMLSARALSIIWGDTPEYWRWTTVSESRFPEVAELIHVCWFEIRGRIITSMLSPATLYAAFFVFKLTAGGYGFQSQQIEVSVELVGGESHKQNVYLDAERQRRQIVPRQIGLFNLNRSLSLQARRLPENSGGVYPKERGDGWMEAELGDFFYEGRENDELEMGIFEVKTGEWKSGLIVQGIVLRPKYD